jgi:hypothetical protein
MIIIDGEEIPGTPLADYHREKTRLMFLELKLCRALLAFGPPAELAAPLHGRIAATLRMLPRHGVTDPARRDAASLTDDEARSATTIIRAMRALPSWPEMAAYGSATLRSGLGVYSLDLADELDARAGRDKPEAGG